MPILTLQDVNYQYKQGKSMVLKDVCATFEPGAIYAVTGKSGAGKSTLLSLIAGLDLPTDGQVFYQGKNLAKMNRDRYRAQTIGVIFQSYNLLNNASAVENLLLSMHISKVKAKNKRELAFSLLAKTGIDRETASRKVRYLSGGEQQRAGIARALSHSPGLMIADEPTGNLDGDTEDTILAIFRQLAQEMGLCVILVTHSQKVAALSDVVYHLSRGRLSQREE